MSAATLVRARTDAINSSAVTLGCISGSVVPPELDRRILDLGERKEMLNPAERDEPLAWMNFTHERSIDRFEAQLALRRLTTVFPEIADQT